MAIKTNNQSKLKFEPATHEDSKHPGVLKKVLFKAEDFGSDLKMLNYAVIKPGESFRLHHHETLEEVFYILQGKALLTINQESLNLISGDAVIIPVNAQHQMTNIGDTDLIYLAFGAARSLGATVVSTHT